jgi:ceramide glucosyltransferase
MLVLMALELLILLTLLLNSRGHVRQGFAGPPPDPAPWPSYPRVALIIPLTGSSAVMETALTSLLRQDYPNYETILVTSDLEDPATSLVRDLLARHPHGRHIVSGPTMQSSQKNRSLLAAVGLVDEGVDILVFCDSTHRARPDFLRELIRPVATGAAVLTAGFHRVVPGDHRLGTLGRLQTIMALHLLHGFPAIALPWGGATAVKRSTFQDCKVAAVLGGKVLDDFPLGQRLLQFGIRSVQVPTAILETDLAGQSLKDWETWLTRQLLYLKYCLPSVWLAFGVAMAILAVPILQASLVALGGLLGLADPSLAGLSLGFLLALTAIGAWCRSLFPQKVSWGPWLLSFYANIFMASWCYLKTWTTDTLAWSGISYRVTWGGWVQKVIDQRRLSGPRASRT